MGSNFIFDSQPRCWGYFRAIPVDTEERKKRKCKKIKLTLALESFLSTSSVFARKYQIRRKAPGMETTKGKIENEHFLGKIQREN